jgi:hypothetical protein
MQHVVPHVLVFTKCWATHFRPLQKLCYHSSPSSFVGAKSLRATFGPIPGKKIASLSRVCFLLVVRIEVDSSSV